MESARRSFFTADEDDEYDGVVASLESAEAGFSDKSTAQSQSHGLGHRNRFSPGPMRGSLRNIPYVGSPVSSPRSGRFYYEPIFEDQLPRFLDSCALCKKPLGNHRDIFMYRGDTAFCSEDCRQEQIMMDEAKEKNRNLSSLRKKDQRKSSTTSPSKSQDCPLHTGTVAAG